jgi:predicted NUDIX family NTP pyrophosphohydrolase
VKQPGGKVVHAFAIEGDCDPALIKSNTFSLEWPPRSGRRREFPEIDRGGWFGLEEAAKKIGKGQTTLIDQLRVLVGEIPGARPTRYQAWRPNGFSSA